MNIHRDAYSAFAGLLILLALITVLLVIVNWVPFGINHDRDLVMGCFLAMAEKCALAHSRLPAEKNDTTCDETPT